MFVLARQYLYQHLFVRESTCFHGVRLHHVKLPKVKTWVPTWLPGANRVLHGKAGFFLPIVKSSAGLWLPAGVGFPASLENKRYRFVSCFLVS